MTQESIITLISCADKDIYNATEIKLVASKAVDCSETVKKIHVWNLNYPSFTLSGKPEGTVKRVFRRTVTNVGTGHSKYKVKVMSSKELKIKVNLKVVRFNDVGETMSFRVTMKAKLKQSGIVSSILVWSDGTHQVRSPVVAHTLQQPSFSGFYWVQNRCFV
ncbi:unnamed protein product [Linum tenue]|uniref:Subtilisin-like protease fibronectin type-III domain-containing protein n=1 Tax=Linum tenue TaxID=586396 RepID=A0AAV0MMH5_9ROSI|nr:unnamed protein product [Linum tenue]